MRVIHEPGMSRVSEPVMDATRDAWVTRFLATSSDEHGLIWFVPPTGLRDRGERVHFRSMNGYVLEFEWMAQPAAVAAEHAAAFMFDGERQGRAESREEWIARFLALSEDEYGLVWRAETGCRDAANHAAHAVAKPLPVLTDRVRRDPLSRDESCVHFFLTDRTTSPYRTWVALRFDGSIGLALNWLDSDAQSAAVRASSWVTSSLKDWVEAFLAHSETEHGLAWAPNECPDAVLGCIHFTRPPEASLGFDWRDVDPRSAASQAATLYKAGVLGPTWHTSTQRGTATLGR